MNLETKEKWQEISKKEEEWLLESIKQFEEGKVITFTIEELLAIENDE